MFLSLCIIFLTLFISDESHDSVSRIGAQDFVPFTAEQPKPLVKVGNKSLLERNILHLYKHGVKEVVVNGSKFGEQIEALINAIELPGLKTFFIDEGMEPLELQVQFLMLRKRILP